MKSIVFIQGKFYTNDKMYNGNCSTYRCSMTPNYLSDLNPNPNNMSDKFWIMII